MGDRVAYSLDQLRTTGVLWLINAAVFHPRGVALALDYADEDGPDADARGWSLVASDDGGPWTFPDSDEIRDRFVDVETLIREALTNGRAPTVATEEAAR